MTDPTGDADQATDPVVRRDVRPHDEPHDRPPMAVRLGAATASSAPGASAPAGSGPAASDVAPDSAGGPGGPQPGEGSDDEERGPRPLVERIGMAAIALVFAGLFGGVTVAAFDGGEPFLGVMAGVGCLMTLWVGGITLFRG